MITKILMRGSKTRLIYLQLTCKVCNLDRDRKQTIIPNIKRKELCEQTIPFNHSKVTWKRVLLGRRSFSNPLMIEEPLTFIRSINSWTISKRKSAMPSTTQMSLQSKPQLVNCHVEIISICTDRSPIRFRYRAIFYASKTSVTVIWADITIFSRWLKTCCWIHKMSLMKKQTRIYHLRFTHLWKGTLKSQIWGLSCSKIIRISKSFTGQLQPEVHWMSRTAWILMRTWKVMSVLSQMKTIHHGNNQVEVITILWVRQPKINKAIRAINHPVLKISCTSSHCPRVIKRRNPTGTSTKGTILTVSIMNIHQTENKQNH